MRRLPCILTLIATAYLATGLAQFAHMLVEHAGVGADRAACVACDHGPSAPATPAHQTPAPKPRTPEKGCAACALLAALHSGVVVSAPLPAPALTPTPERPVASRGISGALATLDAPHSRGPPAGSTFCSV